MQGEYRLYMDNNYKSRQEISCNYNTTVINDRYNDAQYRCAGPVN